MFLCGQRGALKNSGHVSGGGSQAGGPGRQGGPAAGTLLADGGLLPVPPRELCPRLSICCPCGPNGWLTLSWAPRVSQTACSDLLRAAGGCGRPAKCPSSLSPSWGLERAERDYELPAKSRVPGSQCPCRPVSLPTCVPARLHFQPQGHIRSTAATGMTPWQGWSGH